MRKEELIKNIKEKANLPTKALAERAVDALWELLGESLYLGETVELKGIGSLRVSEMAARKGRNPRTGEEIAIPARKTLKITVARAFKERLNV